MAYTPSTGAGLGPTKTSGEEDVHFLAPVSIAALRARKVQQAQERLLVGESWPTHTYLGLVLSIVFTTSASASWSTANPW